MRKASSAAALVASGLLVVSLARAEAPSPCPPVVERSTLVSCALRASLAVAGEERGREVLQGRLASVSPWLPSNPVASFSAAHRSADGTPAAFNWYAALAQEVEIAGQRGTRRNAVERELEAQGARILLQRREVAAAAWQAYFDALAAGEELRLAQRLEAIGERVATVTRAMADRGLASGIDADVADASLVGVQQVRFAAERRKASAYATLATLYGLDPLTTRTAVEGELTELPAVEDQARQALGGDGQARPELRVLEGERKAAEARADAFGRARVPNITVSVLAQNDGFNERVLGAGLAVPIPLPYPVGRTYAGEIAEAKATARRTQTDAERVRRELRLDIAVALQAFASRRAERDAFTPERVQRAEASIRSIAGEVQAARLSIRDAVVTLQALMGLLQSEIAARRALALASVDLARAAGLPLEGGAR